MPVELQELWETAVQFCEDNVIWVLTAAGGLLLLVIVLCVARGGGQRRREADAWMEGFEARMEAFEKNEDPMMPVRKPILTALRESVQDVPQEQKQQTAQTAARASEDALQTAQADGRTAAAVQADRSLNLNLTIHVENVRISKELDAALQEGSCPTEIVQADSIRVEAEALGPQTEAPEPETRAAGSDAAVGPEAAELNRSTEPRAAADADKPGAADETIAEMRGGAAAAGGAADRIERSASPAVQTANGRAVSVSRSGRVYAEEELRRQIR